MPVSKNLFRPVLSLLFALSLLSGISSAQEDFTTWAVFPFTTGGGIAASFTVTSSTITTAIPSCQSMLIMGNPAFNGVPLTDILAVSYSYVVTTAGSSASFIYIRMYIDTTGDGNNDTTLNFIPGGNTTGARSHNPLVDSLWSGGLLPANSAWATVLATYPTATIAQTVFSTPGYPGLIFNIGDTACGWNGWSGSFGAPVISLAGGGAPGSVFSALQPFTFADGRINNRDTAAPIAAYGLDTDGGTGLAVYEIVGSSGVSVLLVSADAIAAVPEFPDSNTLIAQTSTENLVIYFWRLTSGEFQINVIQPNGKMYVLIFKALLNGGAGYRSFEYEMH